MTIYCDSGFAKWLLVFPILICQVWSLPLENENSIKEIFSESKREVPPSGGVAAVSLLKSPLFNPYLMYPGFIPGKPSFYPPLMTPSDLLLNRFAKSPSATVGGKASASATPLETSDPTLISAYFKAKKDEFLTKLFEKLANATESAPDLSRRSVSGEDDEATKPVFDSSFFLKKKYAFLETLFKTLNATTASPSSAANDTESLDSTTAKPTMVPPDFWFPFAKLPKASKPAKPAKPTKPPKAKKILKDALDAILLQSLLLDLGVDPEEASLGKRSALATAPGKKVKIKKTKSDKEDPEKEEIFISPKVDPSLCSAKASDCLDKLFKILLNKTKGGEVDPERQVSPKASLVPENLRTKPSEIEYTSKLDAFLDFLIKSLNATEASTGQKPEKSKGKAEKKAKRSTFLDELLHRVTTPEPVTTATPEDAVHDPDGEALKEFVKECCCCCRPDGNCFQLVQESDKSTRSLMFKPFGSGYWIPQYLYAAKMGMYLDKLMDSINTAAAGDVETESSNVLRRSLDSSASPGPDEDVSGFSARQAAVDLIIAELSELKNELVEAFAEGIKAQKDAAPTPAPYAPSSKKSFKKPFWGPAKFPPPATADPVIPIQKRIDTLNDVYDKLTKIEKTLIFASEPEYDPKLMANLTEILRLTSSRSKLNRFDSIEPTKPTENPDSPAYFLSKTKEYLQNLYADKLNDSD